MVAVIETPRSMSLEDALNEFVRIQNRYSELAEEKKRIMEILIPAAIEARQERSNTCRISNHNGKVVIKVEFKNHVACNTNVLNEVKEMIGEDRFEELFKVEYTPKKRTLAPFLATKTTDERIETAKEKIAEALTIGPASPQFTVEKA